MSAPAGQAVRVGLLGQFSVTASGHDVGSWTRPSARRLLELVLVSPGRRVSRGLACKELFPHLEQHAAARSLSKALSMARGTLAGLGEPGASLLAADLNYIWVASPVEVDADVQEEELRAALGRAPGQDRDDGLAAALAEDAELLADEQDADWALPARERLAALRQEARLALARDRSAGHGRSGPDDVLAAWQSCLDHDAACEEAAGALAGSYFAAGRPERAARALDRCRAALEDLGLRLSPSLERLRASAAREPDPPVPLSSARPPASSLPPQREERRPVTVLFAEVAAPPGLAGTLGLETLRRVVGGRLAAVIAEVEALGGLVTSVSGRGLQALFGAPEAHEDDPERALRAAFRALSAGAAAADAGGGTALRIGVETGPAVVGPIGGGGRVEYGALGDVVSVAAVLQSAARPGSVLVGPATRAAAGHLFTWGAGEEVKLGSGVRPLPVRYLDAPRARPADRRPRLGGSAPLAGRDAELRVLGEALRDLAAGHGSVVVLSGEPGLGKTRLVQECRKRFIGWVGAGSGRMPLWLEGRGASYASGTPYGLYRQLVAGWVGVAPDQPAERLRPALADALENLMGNTSLLPPLARMMGVAHPAVRRTSPEELHRMTFAMVRSVVSRFAAVGPTVLVLEDLHWADPTSVHLTQHLAELTADRPLLLLATTRPEAERELGPAARELRLRPLPADAAGTLAASLIGERASKTVLDAVLASAEGNPLFLEERLASLLETGALVRDRGTWRLRKTNGAEPSQVLERLVRSRADRLSPAAQEAIRAASVLGAEFTAATLAAVLGTGSAAAAAALGELDASDLVHPEPPGSRAPVFRFRHALIQEATYLGLLGAERRDLHARAAAALAATSASRLPEVAGVLARHYAAAGDSGQALRYFELAGDHATDAFANDEAIASFRAPLETAAPADAVRLHAKAASVLWRTGRRAEAKDAFRAAIRIADAGAADALLRAHLYTRLGRLEWADFGFDAAAEAFDTAEALLGDDPGGGDDATADQWLEIMLDGRADMYQLRREPDLALAALEAARPVLEARGNAARRTMFYRVLTLQRVMRNGWRADDTDIASLRLAIEAAAQTGEEKDLGYATHALGWLRLLRGELAQARLTEETAVAMAERIGESQLLAMSLQTLTLTALRQHDTEAVRALIPRTAAAAREAAMPGEYESAVLAARAWLAWQDGRPDDVLGLAAEITERGRTTAWSGAFYRWMYLYPAIAARLRTGAVGEAVTAVRQLLDPAQQTLPGELTAPLDAVVAAWERGEPETARGQLEAALALARELGYF